MPYPPPPIQDKPSINDQMAYGIAVVFTALIAAPLGGKMMAAKETKEVPNALTQSRLLLTPLLLLSLYLGSIYRVFRWIALAIWILGCLSDLYDGRWSRRWGHVSDFGKYWDPVADKAFTIPTLLVFALLGMMPFALLITITVYLVLYICWWIIFTYREWRVTVLRNKFKAKYPKRSVAADNTGKYKTASIMIGGTTIILEAALGLTGTARLVVDIVNAILLGTATCFSLYSWLFIYERVYKLEDEDAS